ncbi:attractin-like [Watersipora subatra]|uniref:attractin-like n=1 Tax=Watersipora subatra TaxID=2589382 RepID=UPI00355BA4B3
MPIKSKNLILFHSLTILFIYCLLLKVQPEYVKCKIGQCENDGVCVNETCVCHEGWTGPLCQFCDGRFRLSSPEGELHDGAGNYSTNTKCSWLIDSNSSKPILLSFLHFSTECGWDHLHVFDGPSVYSPLVGSFSGSLKRIKDVVLHSGKGFIYFYSDIAYNISGFNLTYRVLHCPYDCNGNGRCNSSSGSCECELGWDGEVCNISTFCPNLCSNAGTCLNGTCHCDANHTGEDCSVLLTSISWLDLDIDSAPVGRASMGADIFQDSLYVYGGETLHNRYIIHSNHSLGFYRYDLLARQWNMLPDSPVSDDRFGHSLTADPASGKLYLHGGNVDGQATSDLACYDIASDSWQVLADGLLAVTGHTAHVIDDSLYVFFGQNDAYSFSPFVHTYNISTGNWSRIAMSGVNVRGRFGHSSVYDPESSSVFVFGGYHDNGKLGSFTISNHAYRFLVDLNHWVGLTPAPYIAYLHSAILLPEGYMLVSGGNSHNDTATSSGSQCYSSALLAYNTCCDRWTEIDAVDATDSGINRFGHHTFLHNGSVYTFGGFNGIMLNDVVKLYTPNCSLFLSKIDCELRNFLCEWNGSQGCVPLSWTGDCDMASCGRTDEENKLKCNQFTDCVSCLSTEDCFYRAGSGAEICGVVPPPSHINPLLQNLETCGNDDCSYIKNCNLCDSLSHCSWSILSGSCVTQYSTLDISTHDGAVCQLPCYSINSCGNCTSNGCLWCESQSVCIDSSSYLTYFPYGQCLEWTFLVSKCPAVSCEKIESCKECQRNAMCGWCNDPSNTGKGRCMNGGLTEDINAICPREDWYFASCPACQCNGHSICDEAGSCLSCSNNTIGASCASCATGYYGNPVNGGTCRPCDCDDAADECDDKTGDCHCQVKGAVGAKCQSCDSARQYRKDILYKNECYYALSVGYRYTFNFSKPEEKYVTRINLQCVPIYTDRDAEFTIECQGLADTNLSLYSATYPDKFIHYETVTCPQQSRSLTLSHKDYEFGTQYNATIILTLEHFTTPFVFQVSFTQHTKIDLMMFLLIFFGCFLSLLMIAAFVWKVRARYMVVQRQSQQRQERRIMASRPFSSILLTVDDLKSLASQEQAAVQPPQTQTTLTEPLTPFQRTFSKRSRRKAGVVQSNSQVTAVGLEPLDGATVAIASVMIKLPTGGEEVPAYGMCGLAFGSTLVAGYNANNHASVKVSYKNGKVTFKSSSNSHTS